MTPSSPSGDDDFASLIRAYNSMEDPQLQSDLLAALGLTLQGWKAKVAAHEWMRRSSTDASQEAANATAERESVVVVRVEIRGRRGHRSAPPSRGPAASGPGRPGARRVRIVITAFEE
ncbi:hypothetical protein GCM10023205_18090 [Yinghuangia aomiensis]|uniref:Uncharacterized protein n=1 Tax=Yinghuangia aomiensis TaxID=676205 RepID=A0ABP9GXP7_9ACTN